MQVERLRKRLIKELRERGELQEEGERNIKPRWVQESEALRFQQGSMLHVESTDRCGRAGQRKEREEKQ